MAGLQLRSLPPILRGPRATLDRLMVLPFLEVRGFLNAFKYLCPEIVRVAPPPPPHPHPGGNRALCRGRACCSSHAGQTQYNRTIHSTANESCDLKKRLTWRAFKTSADFIIRRNDPSNTRLRRQERSGTESTTRQTSATV